MHNDAVSLQFEEHGALVLRGPMADLVHESVAHPLVARAGGAPADELTLARDDVERLFERLAARAQGRPATQDSLATDPASSAALLLAREALHHWGLDTLTVRRP